MPRESKRMELPTGQIETDGGTQARVRTDDNVVKEYAELLEDGETLPPIEVYGDGVHYWLADGFHRLLAHIRIGIGLIACIVYRGTKHDAIVHAAGANAGHGLRRSNADKRKAVQMLLDSDAFADKSSRAIAEAAKVSHTFVDSVKADRKAVASRPAAAAPAAASPATVTAGGNVATSTADPSDPAVAFYTGDAPEEEYVPSDPLADAQSEFDAFTREIGTLKAKARRIAEQNPAGKWLDETRLDEFDRRVGNVQAVLKAVRPHAVCSYCGGPGCERCKGSGFLSHAAAESAPTPGQLSLAV